jgi:hypothetical protein
MGSRRYAVYVATAVAMALLAVTTAAAVETTRLEYKEAVEPICKANTKANERILAGVRAKVKKSKLKPAAAQFAKASRALKRTWRELGAVPQPTADQARLAKWLRYVKTEADFFQRTAQKLKSGDKTGALAMVIRLEHNAKQANNQVLPFEFRHCKFEPSKFT